MSKSMPYSLEAEQSLLGSMMVYPNSARIAIEASINENDFYLEAHRRLFAVMAQLYDEKQPIDIITTMNRCNDVGVLSMIGGYDYLIQCTDKAVSAASTKTHADLIKGKSFVRHMIEVSQSIAEDGLSGQVDVDDYLDDAERRVLQVTRVRQTSEFRSGSEVLQSVLENIRKMADNHSSITGVATGFTDLDRVTHGFQRNDLIILAARPSMGKTAFALNLAMNIAQIQRDEAVAIFSLEMPAEQLISRILSAKSLVQGSNIRTGMLNSNEWNQINEAVTELKKAKLFIDDTPGVRVSDIFSKCRQLKSEHGLSCVVIDYIQLITGSGKNRENRQQEVSEISRNLKALARELKVPVIALSQLSRSVESREDKRPMMSDLRESGALEQDADLIMMLYRHNYYLKAEEKEEARLKNGGYEVVEVNIAKHRNGAVRKVDIGFKPDINAFNTIVGGLKDD